VSKRIKRRAHRHRAVFVQEFIHAPDTEIQRTELAIQIAPCGLGQARVAQENVNDVLVDHACARQPDRRQHECFLKDFRRCRIVVARHRSADVMPMADRGEITKKLTIPEIGPDEAHVGKMRATDMGIIENEDVTVGQIPICGSLFYHSLDRERHHADENRQTRLALDQSVAAAGVVKPMAGIMCFGDDRIESCPKQRGVHFVRNLFHAAG